MELLFERRGVFVNFIAQEDQDVITKAFEEYHKKTCVRFRPYKEGDDDFIKIEGKQSGCWSFVGRRGGGQVVNLQNPGCVHHGIIIHELLHALGFYHQQSAYERDDFVRINWENIKLGKKMRKRIYSQFLTQNLSRKSITSTNNDTVIYWCQNVIIRLT